MDIKNKTVLVTGGASGLGAQTARFLSKQGARVALIDQNETDVLALAKDIDGIGFKADVSDFSAIQTVLDSIEKKWDVPSVCVNCAGILLAKRVVSKKGVMPLEDFERVLRVNVSGTFNVLRLVAEKMLATSLHNTKTEQERGVIINTASIAAFDGQIGQAAYSASKGAVAAMTLPLAREFAQHAIRVMTIAPGIMETPMMETLSDKAKAGLIAGTVFPKRLGQPQEFAELVLHIIQNTLLNGEVIRLDGGVRLG